MKVDTLLFDLDGTLIDTNDLIIESFMHTLGQFFSPSQFKKEDILKFMGPPLYESFHMLNPEKAQEMVEVYRKFNKEKHDELVKEYDTVYETIEYFYEKGYKLGVVTSKTRNTVEMGLKLSRLKQFFEVVITVDDVAHAKPHPESIFLALEQLRSKPEHTIMVGDNHHDIEAGKNAGTLTAGVTWSLKGPDYLKKYNPDFMLEKMSDLIEIVGGIEA
ncbi:pyrophosphatase PpaX [Calidifontibacillus oryziterrae]|uniref:pyrophosphatase PpaX n=1 Tax=Calidifontibacillus oryziterrae TaxID=1191699 RepID=UPI0003054444|nr:pyrophosphatase PpaX [Calidifontibacillus oryziterrae]